ncbi:MAG: tRNA dihydrouridine synthase DusB [Holosporaceae bacterium]|jgi:tRNA-dihydrouridine synthase B|nr:tRNA dihydrouridine synthase DusB [Holosporaceae bacterium]
MDFKEYLSKGTPVFLAPMAGITDAPFRALVSNFGATAVVSEMISSEALVRLNKKIYQRFTNRNSLKIAQIVGKNPQRMAESAIISEDLGVHVIDINMGCPARKIVSSGAGAALMKDEDLAVNIAESIVKSVKIPVILKMRLGWDDENINCISLAKKFENVGIQMLTIHCRTRNQMYSGQARWSYIRKLSGIIKIPYLCNGDIKSPNDAICAIQESNSIGIMIGRASLGKPWLINQIMNFLDGQEIVPPPSIEEQFRIVMEHFQAVLDFYGETQGIKMFRKHFCWYSSKLKGSSSFREIINHSEDLSFIKSCVKDFYEKQFDTIL